MSIISAFAARYSALDYAYGINFSLTGGPGGPPLYVAIGNPSAGAGSITVVTNTTETQGGNKQIPITILTPITVGIGANSETFTPTGVTSPSLSGFQPGPNSVTISATFANIHGPQEPVTSGTFGLQEAINAANAAGGGAVVISPAWYTQGGTTAIIQAASLPSNGSVDIEDEGAGVTWALAPSSLTLVAAPAAATAALVASLTGVVGTWTAVTEHVLFTYVTADGGETIASADFSFTATVSLAIGGTGPIAATGAVGYRVYIGTNATTSAFLVPVIAGNGTVVQCGPIAAFKIGTSFQVAAVTTSATSNPPTVQSTAFSGVQPMPFNADFMAQPFAPVSGPFTVTGVVTAGTAIEWGRVQLPLGYLNSLNRTVRINLYGIFTPVSTAALIITVALASSVGTTTTTIFTAQSAATSGTAASNIDGVIDIITAATGATGTVECHGFLLFGGATATPQVLTGFGDNSQAASGAVDLTKQLTLIISINSATANITQSQLRKMFIEVLV